MYNDLLAHINNLTYIYTNRSQNLIFLNPRICCHKHQQNRNQTHPIVSHVLSLSVKYRLTPTRYIWISYPKLNTAIPACNQQYYKSTCSISIPHQIFIPSHTQHIHCCQQNTLHIQRNIAKDIKIKGNVPACTGHKNWCLNNITLFLNHHLSKIKA